MTRYENFDAQAMWDVIKQAQEDVLDEGRQDAISKQHNEGKLSARERISYLCDQGSFEEIGQLAAPNPTTPETYDWDREDAPADGIITGTATIDGRPVAVSANDFTVKGGSVGHTGSEKLNRIAELALENGFPLVMLHDGGGHRIQEGLDARPYAKTDGQIFKLMQKMSGWVPIISAMMGPGFAAPTNYSALSDFVPIVKGEGTLGVAGPSLVEAALGVELSKHDLGGARFQTRETGMADVACEDDEACLDTIKEYLSYLPSNAGESPPSISAFQPPTSTQKERLIEIVPSDRKKGYDVFSIVAGIIDQDSLFQIRPNYAKNLITAFATIDGQPIGITANNPKNKAGTIDAAASNKGARFISFCDAFSIPMVWLIDCPGVLPGPDSEREGIARRSGKLIYEISRATVPTISVVIRRGYGLGYLVMGGGRAGDSQLSVAWPTAEIAAMSIEGAVDIAYRHEYEKADDPEAERQALIDKFSELTGPIRAAEGMGIDAVIHPRNTRDRIITTLERTTGSPPDEWPPKKHSINPW